MHTQAGFLTLLSARNDGPFWTSLPGPHLAGAFVFSVSATTLIGALLKADSIAFWACPIGHIGVTLLYNLAMFLVLDIVKVRSRPSHSRKSGGVGGCASGAPGALTPMAPWCSISLDPAEVRHRRTACSRMPSMWHLGFRSS